MNRRQFLATSAAVAISTSIAARTKAAKPSSATTTKPVIPDDVLFHNVREWGVEGRGFDDTESYFDRLPKRAKSVVRDAVWTLSHHTSGMSAHFETDATEIYVRYALTSTELAMAHMPASGVSGVDLYAFHENAWRWLATHLPKSQQITAKLADRIAPGKRRYHLNLPLYNGVTSLEIGIPKSADFTPTPPRKDKPILFYGTSITQGGCASRPGMAFPAILGRRLGRPILNFGFSGNGRTELEVARFLAELDPAVFVIDTLANTSPEQLAQRLEPLVKLLRERHAETPILLLDERTFANTPLSANLASYHKEKRDILKRAYDNLRSVGDTNLHLHTGADLIGSDGEGTVDGSHPNDLGMMRYADALEPDLRRLL
jgi:lysophospholipase L1-like esterase